MSGMRMRTIIGGCLVSVMAASPVLDASPAGEPQRRPVPQPFPRPGQSEPDRRETRRPVESTPAAAPATAGTIDAPTEEMLGFPIYPAAQFIASYDAGRQQRYYLFGTNLEFEAMVRYYSNLLRERGDRVFDAPATHIFEVGRFREREMAFPPSVTIKDHAGNGSAGYPNPAGGEPARFRTIIQIVPAPPQSRR